MTRKEAGLAATSENEQRDDDPREAKIRRVQRMAKQGFEPVEHIADAMGVRREQARHRQGQADAEGRPISAQARAEDPREVDAAEQGGDRGRDHRAGRSERSRHSSEWTRGAASAEDVLAFYPELAGVLKADGKRAA